ncbi:unnamed protein product [Calypogeia fissa]
MQVLEDGGKSETPSKTNELEDSMKSDTPGMKSPLQKTASADRPSPSEPDFKTPLGKPIYFDAITIAALRPNYNWGRVLYGHFRMKPWISEKGYYIEAVTILVDTNADAINILMRKSPWSSVVTGELEKTIVLGKQVAIRNPYMVISSTGMYAVSLNSPADVIFCDNVKADGLSPVESVYAALLEELQESHRKGDGYLAEEKWLAAENAYSICIGQAKLLLVKSGATNTTREEYLKSVLMLANSNRAEARLQLEQYFGASSDARNALSIDPKHVKTLVRHGKAAYGTTSFFTACIAFKDALKIAKSQVYDATSDVLKREIEKLLEEAENQADAFYDK